MQIHVKSLCLNQASERGENGVSGTVTVAWWFVPGEPAKTADLLEIFTQQSLVFIENGLKGSGEVRDNSDIYPLRPW